MRKLQQHEIVREGDRYQINGSHATSLAALMSIGVAVARWKRSGSWWRDDPPQDNWISFKDRKPAQEDADNMGGFIAVRYQNESVALIAVQLVNSRNFSPTDNTYWMPLNFTPREPQRIKVSEHEVVPNKDGSLRVGCRTISSPDFEEIARQRREAMTE
jgi:hypothetical protein